MKSIYYWSPSLSKNIATNYAVINSAYSINKYSKKYKASIINACGEFNYFKSEIKNKEIDLINLSKFNIINLLPKLGKLNSRFSYMIIFIYSFFSLKKMIKINKPDFLFVHLITSLPLLLLYFINFKTKFVLRISGYPKMNFFRLFLWKIASKKLFLIICPTETTRNLIVKLGIIDESKVKTIEDPIIDISKIIKKKNSGTSINILNKDYFLAVGRLTKQKNFLFLIKAFKKILDKDKNINLVIAGEGELYNPINTFIKQHKLENNIHLVGHQENIYPFFKNAKCFIMSSLWEDPGFVLIESFFLKTPIISSDCPNGPKELIVDNENAFKFTNNNENSFLKSFYEFKNFDNKNLNKLKKNGLLLSKKYTIFNHFKSLDKILSIV